MAQQNAKTLYFAQKQFRFFGELYNPGDPFDPVKAQCPPAKVRTLVQQRFIKVGDERVRETPSALQKNGDAQQAPAAVDSDETASPVQNSTDVAGLPKKTVKRRSKSSRKS